MGKKTNWTTAEDQTLCRVWLIAGDLKLQGGDQKASNFWNVVCELFHQDTETTVERPLNGLKVRWTRINKDTQKFAGIYHEILSLRLKLDEKDIGSSSDAAVASLKEQLWIDEAKSAYFRYYNVKFTFESCWKQLRYSPKWLHLYVSSGNQTTPIKNALKMSTMKDETERATSSPRNEEEVPAMDDNVTTTSVVPSPTAVSALSPSSNSATKSSTAAATVAALSQTSTNSKAFPILLNHKRQANPSESFSHIPSEQLQELTVTLVEQLKRQNDIMEDQNSIALLKVDGELLSDAEAQHSYQRLRTRYLKKARTHQTS